MKKVTAFLTAVIFLLSTLPAALSDVGGSQSSGGVPVTTSPITVTVGPSDSDAVGLNVSPSGNLSLTGIEVSVVRDTGDPSSAIGVNVDGLSGVPTATEDQGDNQGSVGSVPPSRGVGVQVQLDNGRTADVDVNGDITVKVSGNDSEVSGSGNGSGSLKGTGVSVFINDSGTADVDVNGDITVEASNTQSEGDTQGQGVEVSGGTSDIVIVGDIAVTVSDTNDEATSQGMGVVIAPNPMAGGAQKTTVDITGNIGVKAEEATGIAAYLDGQNTGAAVTVTGNIQTEGGSGGMGSTGIYSHLHENTSETIKVDGSIISSGEVADGVNIHLESGATVDIEINGEIQSTSASPEGYASAVEVYANFDGAAADSVFTGDITVESAGNAGGIQLDSEGNGTQNTLTLNGDLKVSAGGDSRAIQAQTYGGHLDLTVNGDVSAVGGQSNADEDQAGEPNEGAKVDAVRIYSEGTRGQDDLDAQMTLQINGDITAEGSEGDEVSGIAIWHSGGDVTVDVNGDMTTSGSAVIFKENSTYWDLQDGVHQTVVADEMLPDAENEDGLWETYYYYREFYDMKDLAPGQNITDLYHMYYNAAEGIYYMAETGSAESLLTWKETIPQAQGQVDLTVRHQDGMDAVVHGDEYGLVIENNNPEMSADVLIDGVLSGDQAGVCVSETAITDQMTLTVWKVKTKDDHPIAATKDSEGTITENQDFAEKIQYIIRTAQPQDGGSFTVDGTQKYKDYDVAHMNDVITLKIEVQEGYEIVGAYNGTDNPVSLQMGSDGNYYLTVPNGGGVSLSVTLQKKQAAPEKTNPDPAAEETQTDPAPTAVEEAPAMTVTVVPAEWVEDTTLQADEQGFYSLSEAVEEQAGMTMEIAGLKQMMPEELLSELSSLPVAEQISVLLSVLGADEPAELSANRPAAVERVRAWFDSLSENEKNAFLRRFAAMVEYDGEEIEGYVFEIDIRGEDGRVIRKRLSFVPVDGAFRLVKVEQRT